MNTRDARDAPLETHFGRVFGALGAQPSRMAKLLKHRHLAADCPIAIAQARFARYERRPIRIALRGDPLLLRAA